MNAPHPMPHLEQAQVSINELLKVVPQPEEAAPINPWDEYFRMMNENGEMVLRPSTEGWDEILNEIAANSNSTRRQVRETTCDILLMDNSGLGQERNETSWDEHIYYPNGANPSQTITADSVHQTRVNRVEKRKKRTIIDLRR